MMKLALINLWHDIKRNAPNILLLFAAFFILTVLLLGILISQPITDVLKELPAKAGDFAQYYEEFFLALEEKASQLKLLEWITFSVAINSMLFLSNILKRLPLRLSRPLYVCAAGKKEKLHYLKVSLFLKIVFSILLVLFFSCILFHGFFQDDGATFLIQLSLWLPLIVSLNLTADPGNHEEVLKKQPAPKKEFLKKEFSSEMLARLYWDSILLIEYCVFLVSVILVGGRWNFVWFGIWGTVFLSNCLIAARCIPTIFRHLLLYEEIYLPADDKES